MSKSKIKIDESKSNKEKDIKYAEIVFDRNNEDGKPVIRGADDRCVYTELHPVSLPEHKPLKAPPAAPACMNIPKGKLRKPPLAYESVALGSNNTASNPEFDIYEVLEDHKCASMLEERLTVKRGDFVQATKTEATRALCFLVDQPDSPTGWIPIQKLKLVYMNASGTVPSKPSPVHLEQAPIVPPKSPDLIQDTNLSGCVQKLGFVGVMSRTECEKMFAEQAKEGSYVIRESTHRVGDYTLSVHHGGKLHHFPIKVTDDKKYLIGGYKFKQLSRIVSYYQVYPLLYNEKNEGVLICEPLFPKKNKKPVNSK